MYLGGLSHQLREYNVLKFFLTSGFILLIGCCGEKIYLCWTNSHIFKWELELKICVMIRILILSGNLSIDTASNISVCPKILSIKWSCDTWYLTKNILVSIKQHYQCAQEKFKVIHDNMAISSRDHLLNFLLSFKKLSCFFLQQFPLLFRVKT